MKLSINISDANSKLKNGLTPATMILVVSFSRKMISLVKLAISALRTLHSCNQKFQLAVFVIFSAM